MALASAEAACPMPPDAIAKLAQLDRRSAPSRQNGRTRPSERSFFASDTLQSLRLQVGLGNASQRGMKIRLGWVAALLLCARSVFAVTYEPDSPGVNGYTTVDKITW